MILHENPRKCATFLIKYLRPMLILAPVILLFLVALALLVLHYSQPDFKYPWMVAAGGSVLALVAVLLWQARLPLSFSLAPWQPAVIFAYSPTWLADESSWPYALALVILGAAVIWTSVARAENNPLSWAGTLLLTALGILAVAAGNPLTLVLIWTSLDLAELVTMLRSTEGEEQSGSVVIAFALRLFGTGLVLWASAYSLSGGTTLDFRDVPARTGIFLLLASGLRLGVLPLHLPYRQENVLRRGLGSSLRLVSAASSLALLSRIPPSALAGRLTPYLLVLAATAGLYAGWMWLRASDELLGRPFWILGMASLAVAASLRANPAGSTALGVALLLAGGLLFLFSARQRSLMVLFFLALWSLSSLPFSLTANAWLTADRSSWAFLLLLLPAQALLLAGFVRHALHPGETSFESQARWAKIIYPGGLLLPFAGLILLGVWEWSGSRSLGLIWAGPTVVVLSIGFTVLAIKVLVHRSPIPAASRWTEIFRLDWLYRLLSGIYRVFVAVAGLVTSLLEGEGGILWSLLLMVLILSILSMSGR